MTNIETPIRPLTPEELKARRAAGIPAIDLDGEISEIHKDVRRRNPKPLQIRERKVLPLLKGKESVQTWHFEGWGGLVIKIENGFLFGEATETPLTCFAPIGLRNLHPQKLVFNFHFVPENDVRVFWAEEGEIQDDITEEKVIPFSWRVNWDKDIPSTPPLGNNFDLVLLNKDGEFIQLQAGLSSKGGRLFISLSEVYAGQVAVGSAEDADFLQLATREIDGSILMVAPLYPENAFLGADFLKTHGMAHGIVEEAMRLKRTKPIEDCLFPEWNPQGEVPKEMTARQDDPWERAVCLWFNAVLGFGKLECADGETCFVHFKNILSADGKPAAQGGKLILLEPMQVVALRWENGDKGRKARSVKLV